MSRRAVGEPNDLELRLRISAWLKYYMKQAGLLQREVAEMLGMKEATVSNLLKGKRGPGLDTFVRMHLRLGLNCNDMVRMDPPPLTGAATGSHNKGRTARK